MRGYTLMELMVTVALLALMSAMTAVGLQPLQTRLRLRQATDATAQVLIRARQRAISSGRCHQVDVLAEGIPVEAGTRGDGLRISRRRDADCEAPADPLALVEVERITLPERMRVVLEKKGELVFRSTGRTRDDAPWRYRVMAFEASVVVIAAANGPVCTLDEAGGTCP